MSPLPSNGTNGTVATNGKASQEPLQHYQDWPSDSGFKGAPDITAPVELTVQGHIPDFAAGTLYRTGPDGYQVDTARKGNLEMSHWFDGFSKVHRFQIVPVEVQLAEARSGETDPYVQIRVLYNSKSNVEGMIERIRKSGNLEGFTFGQKRDPCQSLFKKFIAAFEPPRFSYEKYSNLGVTMSVNTPGLQSRNPDAKQTLWAKTDAAAYKELDWETLEPMGLVDQTRLHPALNGPMSSAHAKSDPITHDVYNYNLLLGPYQRFRVFRVNAKSGKTDILAVIPGPAGYVHSFFLTESSLVLCVWGGRFSYCGAKILWEKNILDALDEFNPNLPAKWFVIDRTPSRRGIVATYNSDAFFCFHTINAYEEQSPDDHAQVDIVAQLTQYDNLDILKRFYYDNILSSHPNGPSNYAGEKGDSTRPYVVQWRLPAVNSQVRPQDPSKNAVLERRFPRNDTPELPNINHNYLTKPHRYVYGVADRDKSSFVDGLVKLDTKTGEALFWEQQGHTPSECIVIPRPEATEEDDAVLLTVVLDGYKAQSYLLCLNARDMKELGRAEVGAPVGLGFHGLHVRPQGERVIGVER
ncbi:MAG: hypothetical protein M1814_000446 [Vezdaea aestivalis]|nr:MAG: hypothetical protein M1814_000446 [Vezdaea aestivalis]